ncbi:hypothetical protein [Providencia sp. PROV120]|uniref:hypothetical protein n=1 Tax=Providencia sp. PROV120 TaxID=2949831 RepID=UPI0023497DD8|nr:hypothetical protein [Providencia sp. PROV120]
MDRRRQKKDKKKTKRRQKKDREDKKKTKRRQKEYKREAKRKHLIKINQIYPDCFKSALKMLYFCFDNALKVL